MLPATLFPGKNTRFINDLVGTCYGIAAIAEQVFPSFLFLLLLLLKKKGKIDDYFGALWGSQVNNK